MSNGESRGRRSRKEEEKEEEEENSLVSIRGKRRPSRCRPMKTDGGSPEERETERILRGFSASLAGRPGPGSRGARAALGRCPLAPSLGLRSQINNIPIPGFLGYHF